MEYKIAGSEICPVSSSSGDTNPCMVHLGELMDALSNDNYKKALKIASDYQLTMKTYSPYYRLSGFYARPITKVPIAEIPSFIKLVMDWVENFPEDIGDVDLNSMVDILKTDGSEEISSVIDFFCIKEVDIPIGVIECLFSEPLRYSIAVKLQDIILYKIIPKLEEDPNFLGSSYQTIYNYVYDALDTNHLSEEDKMKLVNYFDLELSD